MLGGRPPAMVVREILRARNYVALWRMRRVYPRFRENAGRYFLGRGAYPYDCQVRTPQGIVTPTLFSGDDMWTVNEVFCRRDYGDDRRTRSVVDIGSNIGISALFFLTRNAGCRAWLHEPVPRNIERLRANLAGYEDRYELKQVAVAERTGRAQFGVERSGRYGGLGVSTGSTIEVECRGVNDLLEEVLDAVPVVDVLKIDTEGSELDILRAIHPELLDRVRTAYLEVGARPDFVPGSFDSTFHNDTWVLTNRAQPRTAA
jgi:FkbM family methyltransferase